MIQRRDLLKTWNFKLGISKTNAFLKRTIATETRLALIWKIFSNAHANLVLKGTESIVKVDFQHYLISTYIQLCRFLLKQMNRQSFFEQKKACFSDRRFYRESRIE